MAFATAACHVSRSYFEVPCQQKFIPENWRYMVGNIKQVLKERVSVLLTSCCCQ